MEYPVYPSSARITAAIAQMVTTVSQETRANDTSICLLSGQRQRPAGPQRGGGPGRRRPPDRDVAGPPWLRGAGRRGPGACRQRRPGELGGRGRGVACRRRRRRRTPRQPFARVHYPGGRSAAYSPETEAGRQLFLAASRLVDLAE